MKRANILLIALGIALLTSSVMAFKVSRTSQIFIYRKTSRSAPCAKVSSVNLNPIGQVIKDVYTTAIDQGPTVPCSFCTMTITMIAE